MSHNMGSASALPIIIPTRPSFRVFGLHRAVVFFGQGTRIWTCTNRPVVDHFPQTTTIVTDHKPIPCLGLIRLARGVLSLLYTEFVISCLPRLVANSVPSLPIPKNHLPTDGSVKKMATKPSTKTLSGEIVKAQVSLGSTQNDPRTASVSLPETRRLFFLFQYAYFHRAFQFLD